MILGFKQQFVDKIMSGHKIHTLREDKKNRWSRYHIIHFATGVRTKDYHCFLTRHCVSVQNITIEPIEKVVYVDGKWLSDKGIQALVKNDGFDSIQEFWQWFDKPFEGKIIHWTSLKY